MMCDSWDEIDDVASQMEAKYIDLVWFARSDPNCYPDRDDKLRAAVFVAQTSVEGLYPEEVAGLNDPESSDWQHGFNSGMLAALRWFATAREEGIEMADSEFPFLDT